ncbi:MAG: hypothetical protein LBS11_03900 [Oscillospiraceae bacterium]|jgi:hypothetical protein|nr:hypothetical protein [Oscillospiraceae bacterium]
MDQGNRFSRLFGKNGLDERQAYLAGRMYKHIVVYLGSLMILNGLLADNGVIWADGFMTNALSLYAACAAGIVEKAFRGIIDYGKKATKRLVALVGAAAVVMLLYALRTGWDGGRFVEDGMLSGSGGVLVIGILMCAVEACLLLRWRVEAKRREA